MITFAYKEKDESILYRYTYILVACGVYSQAECFSYVECVCEPYMTRQDNEATLTFLIKLLVYGYSCVFVYSYENRKEYIGKQQQHAYKDTCVNCKSIIQVLK